MQKVIQPSREGTPSWEGVLYEADGRKDKVMIVMSGSDGGLGHAGKLARFLADHGIPALAFALFHTKHTGRNLDRIPVERVGETIAWLRAQGYQKIGIEGVSKGTEYTLAAAIRYPELSCVILKTPSWYYSEGLVGKQPAWHCCWTFQGRELPYTPYVQRRFHALKLFREAGEYNLLPVNTGKSIRPESVIPIEKIHAPILMFSTKADTVWPSAESCEKLCARLKEYGFAYPYRHVCFEKMSHMMLEYCGKEIRWFMKSEKQFPEICQREREQMGRECIEWIKMVWK